jgi:hypothetical protein
MRLQFYVTDFDPHGQQDLLVIDGDGTVVDSKANAVWGLHVNPNIGKTVLGDQIIDDPEMRQSLMDSSNPSFYFVYRVPLNVIKRHIAVSEENGTTEVEAFIEKYSKVQ